MKPANRPSRRLALPVLAIGAMFAILTIATAAHAQATNPVYLDDSPAAVEGLTRALELASSGNTSEAVRVLQRLLDEEGERVVPVPGDADRFVSVRARLLDLLLESPALLARYREQEHAAARRLLDEGEYAELERTRLLTRPGFEGALREAQRRLETGRFWSAVHALEQLERHPDRRDEGAAEAARLLRLVARYADDDAVHARAERWSNEAALDEPRGVRRIDPPPIEHAETPYDTLRPVTLDGMLERPLWSESLTDASVDVDELLSATVRTDDAPSPLTLRLHVLPAVAGDTIYVNTGDALHAWDRFTFSPRWRSKTFTDAFDDRRFALTPQRMRLDDANTVAVEGPWVVCVTGVSRNWRREGDARVHAFDSRTGEPLWSVNVAALDPQLSESWVRGPVIIDQGIVVVAAIKQAAQRRLLSAYLVGLDLATGELRWRRLLGSAGSSPYGPMVDIADAGTLNRGVVFRMDSLGVVSAIESATGRLRWALRIAPEPFRRRETNVWETHAPAVGEAGLFTLTPDRRQALVLDPETGARLHAIPAEEIGNPTYILLADDRLVSVSSEEIWVVGASPGNVGDAPMRAVRTSRPYLRGRVVIAGGRAFAPVNEGLLQIDFNRRAAGSVLGAPEVRTIVLDRPGNILPLPDQLVVVDDYEVHTYLLWEVAERMLTERIRRDEADPTPAVTYTELAYRAGRADAVLPATKMAIEAIARAPTLERNEAARARLFASLLTMVDAPAPGLALRDDLSLQVIERMKTIATAPEERVAHLMVAGAHAERRGAYADAALAYQTMLDDPELSRAVYARTGVSVRADVESGNRLRRVVRAAGPGPYALFEAEARRALDAVGGRPDANAYEQIAARWPVSGAASEALLRAADVYERAQEPERATRALEAGLLAAEDALVDNPVIVGELAGRLVRALDRAGQPRAALQTFDRLREQQQNLVLTERGEPIDAGALRFALVQRVDAFEQRARIGPVRSDRLAQPVQGWRLAAPLVQGAAVATRHVVLAGPGEELALFEIDEDAGGLKHRWSLTANNARLVRVDRDSVYFAEPVQGGAEGGMAVMRVDADAGPDRPRWATPAFRTLFPSDPSTMDQRIAATLEGRPSLVHTPLAGPRAVTELLVVFDHRTMALVERSGRAAAFDLETGEELWKTERTVERVHDVAAEAGALVIAGANERPGARDDRAQGDPALIALDIRSGRTIHRESLQTGAVRWVRLATDGRAFVGMDGGVECIDIHRRMARWRLVSAQARLSTEAWLASGRLLVMDSQDNVWQISTADGRLREEPLDSRSRMLRSLPINAYTVGDRAAFATPLGVVVFDESGDVVGRDVRTGVLEVLPAAMTQDHFVTIDADTSGAAGVYTIRLYSRSSVALVGQQPARLPANPSAIGAIDDRVIVTVGDTTYVYDAPAPPKPAPQEHAVPERNAPGNDASGVIEPDGAETQPHD